MTETGPISATAHSAASTASAVPDTRTARSFPRAPSARACTECSVRSLFFHSAVESSSSSSGRSSAESRFVTTSSRGISRAAAASIVQCSSRCWSSCAYAYAPSVRSMCARGRTAGGTSATPPPLAARGVHTAPKWPPHR